MLNLNNARTAAGLLQRQAADHLGITLSQYQKYEYGKSMPSFDTAIKLADLFNCSLDDLAGRDFVKPNPELDEVKRQLTEVRDALNRFLEE